jgi:hypothetical protein
MANLAQAIRRVKGRESLTNGKELTSQKKKGGPKMDIRGMRVIVRGYGGQPAVRRVWGFDEATVFVADERTFLKIELGDPRAYPAGFPVADVFEYDETIVSQIDNWSAEDAFAWDGMKRWQEVVANKE